MIAETASAVERAPTGGRPRALGSRLVALLEQNGTLALLLSATAFGLLFRLSSAFAADSWMVLVSGREIAAHGLPGHDTITVWAHGRRWVDQQWLAQLSMYGLQRLGGFRLLALAHAALAIGGFAAACALARRRGASAVSVTWIGALGLFAYYPAAVTIRAQSFAYALFVAVLALLVYDRPHRAPRVFLVFPLLALWANLHGSVVVGAGLVSCYGVVELAAFRRSAGIARARAATLTLVPWACVLASPYATSLPSYYRWILLQVHFERYITEWSPTNLSLGTAPVYVLLAGGAWLFGRVRRDVHAFELAAFSGTALLALHAKRYLPWFGLTAILVLPVLLDQVRRPAPEPRRANRILAGTAIGLVLVTVAVVATKGDSWLLRRYPATAANAAAAAARAHGRVFANESYADWLVWEHPQLAGRIAFDARFELLSVRQLVSLRAFRAGLVGWQAGAAGYDVLVLSAKDEQPAIRRLVRSGLVQEVAAPAGIVVLRRKHTA